MYKAPHTWSSSQQFLNSQWQLALVPVAKSPVTLNLPTTEARQLHTRHTYLYLYRSATTMASPRRSPFREHLVNNRSRSASPSATRPMDSLSALDVNAQQDNDENSVTTSFSYSPSKRSNNNSVAAFHSSGKARSMDAPTIAALRLHSIIQTSTTTSSSNDDVENLKLGSSQPMKSSSVSAADLVLSPQNPFHGIMDIEQKPGVAEIIQVETVTSQDEEEMVNTNIASFGTELLYFNSEDIVNVPNAGTNENSGMEQAKESIIVQNPFEPYVAATNLSARSGDSFIFSEPAPQDDSFCLPVPCKKQSVEHEATIIPALTSDTFSGVRSNVVEAESGIPALKTQSVSSDEGTIEDKSDPGSSVVTNDTYGHLKSMTDRTPRIHNLDPISPPMTPKQRYLEAVKRSSSVGKKEALIAMSPKDRYLLAVQQAAAKCKTMVSTPKEIVTGPNPTPKSSVKAQIKRVEKGGFQRTGCISGHIDSVLFIPASLDQAMKDKGEENSTEFRSPEFESASSAPTAASREENYKYDPSRGEDGPVREPPTLQPRVTGSAFHTFHQNIINRSSSSGELPVKEQVEEGGDTSPVNSYLQLDLSATGSSQKLELKPSPQMEMGAMDALRSSLAVIWNSKPMPEASKNETNHQKSERWKRGSSSISSLSSTDSKSLGVVERQKTDQSDACCQMQPEAGVGPMESLRSSLMMIWNSKPTPQLLPSSNAQTAKSTCDLGPPKTNSSAKNIKDIESQVQKLQNREDYSDYKRGRVFSEDSDASSYRRTQRKKTRRSDGLSSRQRPLQGSKQERLPMGSQYLTTGQRGRSASRERTITPIPSDEDLYDPGLLGNRASYDSLDEGLAKFADPYRNPPRYAAAPSPVRPTPTTETEDSFINAALQARNAEDVVVVYSKTPDKRDWHPPEQERKEHDTMVRAILERPSLIDKSIRESRQPRYWDWRQVRKWVLLGFAMLLFVATIAGCLACGITGSCARREAQAPQTEEVEEVQPLVLNLPIYTQESLSSLHSAQTKAYFWLER